MKEPLIGRTSWALLVLLLLQAGWLWFSRPKPPPAPALLFSGFSPEAIDRLTIFGPAPEDTGPPQPVLRLKRGAEGWVFEGSGYPVRTGAVQAILSTLAGLRRGPAVLKGPRYLSALGLGEGRYEAAIALSAGTSTASLTPGPGRFGLVLGRPATGGEVYARLPGEAGAMRLTGISAARLPARAWAWAKLSYLKVPEDQLTRVSLRGPGIDLSLSRDKPAGPWRRGDCAPPGAAALVEAARRLTIQRPVDHGDPTDFGLGEGALQVSLQTVAGTQRYAIGARAKSGGRYVKDEASPFVVVVTDARLAPLFSAEKAVRCLVK